MILAIVIAAQVSAAAPPNPCSDQLATLCRISPYFCPGAYPEDQVPGAGNVPCWPRREPMALGATGFGTRETVSVPIRSGANPGLQGAASFGEDAAAFAAGVSSSWRIFERFDRLRRWLAERFSPQPREVER
jgi:hypothetical protein